MIDKIKNFPTKIAKSPISMKSNEDERMNGLLNLTKTS